jgi:hypothetical protein
MARYTKTGTPNTIGELNSQLDLIATAVGDTLSRKGDSPNQMESPLDMNNSPIINLPAPTTDNEPVRLVDFKTLNPLVTAAVEGLLAVTEELLPVTSSTFLYTFPTVKPIAGSAFYMRDVNGDLGTKLIKDYDYRFRTDVDVYTLELTRSWNTGNILQRVFNSFSGGESEIVPNTLTTTQLIGPTIFQFNVGDVVEVQGYLTAGDGGNAKWVRTDVVGQTPSQSPAQLLRALLNDADGNQWRLIGDLHLQALGGTNADVTLAYNAAVGALNSGVKGTIILPAGDFNINPATTATIFRVAASIIGGGMGISRFVTSAAGGVVTKFEKNGGREKLSITDVSYMANSGTTSTAIQAQDTSLGVNGGIDSLVLSNVEIEAFSGHWWRRSILTIDTGGLVINYVYLRNGGQAAAQNDVNTAGIEIRNLTSGVFVIRAIDASHLYIQRANSCVLCTTEESIESVYFNSGEMVGADYGIKTDGSGKVGAIKVDVHMDCIKRNILANTEFNFAKIIGDLRLSTNGAPIDVSAVNCEFNGNVEMMLATGSTSSGAGHINSAAYRFNGNIIQSQIDPQIRASHIGIDMTNAGIIFGVSCDPTFSNAVNPRFRNVPTNVFLKGAQTSIEFFSGNVDDLFNKVVADGIIRKQTQNLSGATGLPAGVDPTGSMITTCGIDSNAGHQTLTPFNTNQNFNYVRTKRSGVIGAWSRQGANVNGTFASPTSITVENGIITAIS